MKLHYTIMIFFAILILVNGCAKQQMPSSPSSLEVTCEKRIENGLKNDFGLEPGEYSVEYTECNQDRQGYYMAKIIKDDELFEISSEWVVGAPGGGGSHDTLCLYADEPSEAFNKIKRAMCENMYPSFDKDYCLEQGYEDPEKVIQDCISGTTGNYFSISSFQTQMSPYCLYVKTDGKTCLEIE
jgi:hypothetical protein